MTEKSVARRAGRLLQKFPQLHAAAKAAYFQANWILRPDRSSESTLAPLYEIMSPAQWAGTTEPEGHTFFGYYDKSPWSPDGTRFLLHALRRPRLSEDVSILVMDAGARECRSIARSAAWNFQQGAMTQWIRWDNSDAIAFNALDAGRPVTRIMTASGVERAVLELPIQCSTRDGDCVASVSFARLSLFRPEYGYSRLQPISLPPLDQDGLFLLDTHTGTWTLRVTLRQLVEHEPNPQFATSEHWLNHVAFTPEGKRLVFLHRWGDRRRQSSRLYVLDLGADRPQLLLDGGLVSHYCWLDEQVLLCFCESAAGYRYHTIDTQDGRVMPVASPAIASLSDGHPSFCARNGRIVTDIYPNRYGRQRLLVLDRDLREATEVAAVSHPPGFRGASRCDLHPRWSPDGSAISFDSVMGGIRRSWIVQRVVHDDR